MNHETDEEAYERLYKQFKGKPPVKRKEYTVKNLLSAQSVVGEIVAILVKRKAKNE